MTTPSPTVKWLAIAALLGTGLIHLLEARRTVGLPGLPAEPGAWLEPIGVASLVCETLFVILFVLTRKVRADASP